MKSKKLKLSLLAILILLIAAILFWNFKEQSEATKDFAATASTPTKQPTTTTSHSATPPKWDAESQGHFLTCGAADSHGRIWIGSEENGLWSYDPAAATEEWQHFGTDEGLGDAAIYAVAIDSLDRVWVGHLRHGVSVFNGHSWKNYDIDTGPLGQRVYRISVCPTSASSGAGDVWIGTNLGLSRYSLKNDSWSYYTRADGLPSDQVTSLAFASDGTLYIGTPCDGIATASPSDNYATWRAIGEPGRPRPGPPLTATGDGLPSNVINALTVTHDGTFFVATDHGLARSTDGAKSFTFMRGSDWIAKTEKSILGAPKDWQPPAGAKLAEDYITAIAEDGQHQLWLGYRTKGFQSIDPQTFAVQKSGPHGSLFTSNIVTIPGQPPLVVMRGNGLLVADSAKPSPTSLAVSRPHTEEFPSPAKPLTESDLAALTNKLRSLTDPAPRAVYLTEDWSTHGDFLGRYGRQQVFFAGYGPLAPDNKQYAFNDIITGPHNLGDTSPYVYYASKDSPNPRVLYFPGRGRRQSGEWNDGGWQDEKFGLNFQGPDLWLDITVPPGMHRFSIYTCNSTGHNTLDRFRDYIIEVKEKTANVADAQTTLVLAHARVLASQNPAYRTFLLSGGNYWVRIASNYSHMAGSAAIFFDHADALPDHPDDAVTSYSNGVNFAPPKLPAESEADSPTLTAARNLWLALDQSYEHANAVPLQLPSRVQAYRVALAANAPKDLLANWRWNLKIWSPEDRKQWTNLAAESKAKIKPQPK